MSQPRHRRPTLSPTPLPPSEAPKRRLLTPDERFGTPENDAAKAQTNAASTNVAASSESAGAENDPFLNDPFMREIVPEDADIFAPPAESRAQAGAGLSKNASRHRKKKWERHHVEAASKHEVKHFERHALPGHEGQNRPLSPRRAARRQKVRRFARRVLFLGALFFAVQMGVAAFSAPQFQVETVQIEGLNDTPENLALPLAKKLVGQNVFRANRRAVQKSLLGLPTVKEVRVQRVLSFPPKMRVVVTERTPLARVGAGQNWWVVDETGKPFRRADKPEDEKLYALTAPQFDPQNQPTLPVKDWKVAHQVLMALQNDNASEREKWNLRRVYLDKNGLASLRLSDKAHPELLVRLGEDDFARKLGRARQSLDYLQKTGRSADELNLISYEFPRWRPKSLANGETPPLARESEPRENSALS